MTSPTSTDHSLLHIADIVGAYFEEPPHLIERCGGGIINATYLLHFSDDKKYILQRLNTLFSEATVADFHAVSTHLLQSGRKVQKLIPTSDKKHFYQDSDGNLWRALSYVHGTDAPEIMTVVQLESVGKLLGDLHETLSYFTYKPTFAIPNFHDTAFYAQKLSGVYDQITGPELKAMADECLRVYKTLALPAAPMQLIHGDPRTTNIIFDPETETASCYIDFDTLMHGSPWVDIGDLMRSISGSKDQTQEVFSAESVHAIMRGYFQARPGIAPDYGEAMRGALISLQVISIELAMRFLIDVVEDYYFGWDAARFQSRKDNNVARAKAQLAIYRKASAYPSSNNI